MNQILSYIMIVLVSCTGLFLGFKYRFVHLRKIPAGLSLLFKGNSSAMSSFSAMMAVIGGNLGTGNISGIAVALATGGPGAVVWICIAILITSSIKYWGCFISITQSEGDAWGPMHYIGKAIPGKSGKIISVIYSLSLIIGVLTIGNFVQSNSVAVSLESFDLSESKIYLGITMAFFVTLVIAGGMKRFANVISSIVPAMGVIYVIACSYILFCHSGSILPAFITMFKAAFTTESVSGAVVGFGAWAAIQSGFDRGIFASESGLGIESIVHSTVKSNMEKSKDFAMTQGAISVVSSIIVMIVCVFTSLVLLVTDVWDSGLINTVICFKAFESSIPFGGFLLFIMLFCFAFTTMLTWNFCAERCIKYLSDDNKVLINIWRMAFIFVVPLGAVAPTPFVWLVADIMLPMILIPNTIAVFLMCSRLKMKE